MNEFSPRKSLTAVPHERISRGSSGGVPGGVPGEFRGVPGSSAVFFVIFRYAAPWKNVDWREFRSQPPQVFIILKGGPRGPQGSLEPTHGLLAWSSFLQIYHGPVSKNLLPPCGLVSRNLLVEEYGNTSHPALGGSLCCHEFSYRLISR